MQQVPMVWLEDSLEHRVERILQDYVIDLCAEFVAVHGDEGFSLFSERLLASLDNIHKRLGGDRHRRLMNILETALAEQANSGAVDLHRGWIEGLLREYYDPMYVFQREKKGLRIEFSGEQAAVSCWSHTGTHSREEMRSLWESPRGRSPRQCAHSMAPCRFGLPRLAA